ncbi:YbjQ family protein [Deinococcus sp. KNUC1210]|uniref:YbjQ family protein n=1 Tax=Deinococcus sp. KNUC1210 TaxID=2917691 RepID=UPI001EEFF829|nr:YbjQ family protein [Deinococcus sp. KNUC1210]ULH15777.1 YbjQ family protein [Deinococcus sp. KNUC1210]
MSHPFGRQSSSNMDMLITTTNELEGYRVVRQLGLVRGLTVRSRSVLGNIGASLQTLLGGNITLYTELAEKARQEAYDLMIQHAQERGANAVLGMRYDANEITDGVTEVLAYGTAVVVEAVR